MTDGFDPFTAGMETRRRVLGTTHVDRAEGAKTSFDERFQRMITEAAWGHVWSNDHFTPRERSMVTFAILASLGRWDEVEMHVRASRNTGATPEDLAEVLMHVAIYAGIPAANHAIKIAKTTLAAMDAERESEMSGGTT
ncbi:4-carboxymuconolactone decarboxylase [Acuticoccus mangrovi]|uniref:4-carboxymuconolactone decarboxylase n=1 Tax=Acuticoccus mangrovi TaxID=2796142 RepID=A0A934IMN6_9HYPH|nr:4-carboxymuconolactone decarboxylase [Acuticoccus mangrovi]MBJ3775430.1 4-carboxymuconolactone decarboxylase [Acuticoccus mangrovi]